MEYGIYMDYKREGFRINNYPNALRSNAKFHEKAEHNSYTLCSLNNYSTSYITNYYLLSIATSPVMNKLDAFCFKDLILFLFK